MSRLNDERELLPKPGDTILESIEYLKMSQVELADRMGKTPSKINDLISGKEPITIATALQLEKVLGIDAQFWLNKEMLYREKFSRIEQEETLTDSTDWLDSQPLKELKANGFISSSQKDANTVEECLKFYGVAAPQQWESLYVGQYVSAAFRKSPAHKSTLGALAAWLRIGELNMKKRNIQAYDKKKFKDNLIKARALVRSNPEDFPIQLIKLCSDAGVALVYTISINKAPVSGVVRWVAGSPLIQLTDRYKSNDQFWFSFFHEVAHILLHGKKEVFVEGIKGLELNEEKEKEADAFARKTLLPDEFINDLSDEITEKEIRNIARKYDTHAAIVIGRLQHLKRVPFTFGSSFKSKVLLDEFFGE
ncbi:antitoxin transcriptional regulator of toxin/antitoxin module [Psychroflexus torquis ATCC 700755]|uniref:Antitoxin transcriptional regulator of toxin/antitoxin module n=1 Tax=Psychroflexus torquis (strain ATCC 700755 / CIP 106069 / ACAM 623) TaxID=313595 RepID=K4IG64_PSYTT|nr:HigA family addiction module antitoxin [Psychroflexus torquis]AFU68808.1 antitoxin transcriptional regulator of toxin/antitoxin module [Psychroflexus torquis ATCC 700755]